MDLNLHSLPRRLIELRMEHADLDNLIDQASLTLPDDELSLRRLKKRRLKIKDEIARSAGIRPNRLIGISSTVAGPGRTQPPSVNRTSTTITASVPLAGSI